ncbi:hypothetical protein [Adlercreutzia aquisgranensis]|uniref:hypothetical protein n=1 Tax=Adlercreutzia aquisgranensis TaxID=2941323 RepID=UPI00203D75A5|nr:hypothetical protein [Adlercreutzia aquisgranensis]
MLKVRSKYLLLIAGVVWLLAGLSVTRLGVLAIMGGVNPWFYAGIPVVFVLFGAMFFKLVEKHSARIHGYGDERMHVLKFFDVKGYIVMAVMMGGGIALRSFGIVPSWFVAFFYTGLGLALASAGIGFFCQFFLRHRTGHPRASV